MSLQIIATKRLNKIPPTGTHIEKFGGQKVEFSMHLPGVVEQFRTVQICLFVEKHTKICIHDRNRWDHQIFLEKCKLKFYMIC